jgi:hypothetical protein
LNALNVLVVTSVLAAKGPKPGDWSFGWMGVASIAEVALAVIICLWIVTTYFSTHRQRESNSPWRLFADLCSTHKLTGRQRRMLKRLAREHELDQPAMLFVEPTWYSAEKVGPGWRRQVEELDGLRQRLFATH